jgi:hypothetical protein
MRPWRFDARLAGLNSLSEKSNLFSAQCPHADECGDVVCHESAGTLFVAEQSAIPNINNQSLLRSRGNAVIVAITSVDLAQSRGVGINLVITRACNHPVVSLLVLNSVVVMTTLQPAPRIFLPS